MARTKDTEPTRLATLDLNSRAAEKEKKKARAPLSKSSVSDLVCPPPNISSSSTSDYSSSSSSAEERALHFH